ncbi:MAG: CZB domain-containing protein [Planctomycetes bacterium]|nr:CZB domain-containing protein [Planctomycetota bacterium]
MDTSKFVSAHYFWKIRLKQAIDTGKSDVTVENAAKDDCCDFGKHFYSLATNVQRSPIGQTVRTKHAEFHKEASRILALALAGRKDEATRAIASQSPFSKLSTELTNLITDWGTKAA